jgi:hypothetical protein
LIVDFLSVPYHKQMPTLPSTQTQSANGVPLYVPTDGDGNAVVSGNLTVAGSVLSDGSITSETFIAAVGQVSGTSMVVGAQPDGTKRSLAFPDATPAAPAALVSYDGLALRLENGGVTGLSVSSTGAVSAPVSMSANTYLVAPAVPNVNINQFTTATGLSAGAGQLVATLDVSALSKYRMIGVLLNDTPLTSTSGNWIEGSGSGATPGGSGSVVVVGYQVGGNAIISSEVPMPLYGAVYGVITSASPSYTVIAYPGNGLLYVTLTANFTSLPQTVVAHLDMTVFGII